MKNVRLKIFIQCIFFIFYLLPSCSRQTRAHYYDFLEEIKKKNFHNQLTRIFRLCSNIEVNSL